MDGFFSSANYFGFVDIGIYLCYAGCIIGGILAILFPVFFIAQNPKSAKTTGLGILTALILFGISYALSSGDLNEYYVNLGVDTVTLSRLIGASLILLYICGIGAVAIALGTEIIGLFRR